MTFGTFVLPNALLEPLADPAATLGIQQFSGYRASEQAREFQGKNSIFDAILQKSHSLDLNYEDQCSAKYYFDLVRTLRDFHGEFDRVVEVGVYMGGSSNVLAGCIPSFNFDLDMVDVHIPYLHFSYERIRRLYPNCTGRIRLFHGDLPSYVRAVLNEDDGEKYVVHHDGSHEFNDVVRDMASLSFIKERLCAIIAQDTHLRGTPKYMNFVDMAMYAVFGMDLQFAPIGCCYAARDPRTNPNIYEGNYFMPEAPEGFVLPMAFNKFKYPHPNMPMEQFVPPECVSQPKAYAA